MKVIAVDNYGRESVADVLVAENLSEDEAKVRAEHENAKAGPHANYFYRAVPDDHRLWRGMEELV